MSKVIKTLLKNVTTAGTRVALSSTKLVVRDLTIKARSGNAGILYLGDVTVAAANAYQMTAGDRLPMKDLIAVPTADLTWDLSKIYIDAATNGDGVTLIYCDSVPS